jgi:hypothetical protein
VAPEVAAPTTEACRSRRVVCGSPATRSRLLHTANSILILTLTRIDGAGFFAIARQRQPAVNGLHKIARIAGGEIALVAQVRR